MGKTVAWRDTVSPALVLVLDRTTVVIGNGDGFAPAAIAAFSFGHSRDAMRVGIQVATLVLSNFNINVDQL
jgi:hypothetical protein